MEVHNIPTEEIGLKSISIH